MLSIVEAHVDVVARLRDSSFASAIACVPRDSAATLGWNAVVVSDVVEAHDRADPSSLHGVSL